MISTILSVLRDPVLHRVGLGWIAVITLDQLNALVGLLVGIATLVYLCLRIRDQLRDRNSKSTSD